MPGWYTPEIYPATLLMEVEIAATCQWLLSRLRAWWTTNWTVHTYHPPTDLGVTIHVTGDIYGVPYASKVHVRPHDCHGAVLGQIQSWWQAAATIKDWPPTKVHITSALRQQLDQVFVLPAPGQQAATDVAIYCEESPLVVYVLPAHSPQLQSAPEELL